MGKIFSKPVASTVPVEQAPENQINPVVVIKPSGKDGLPIKSISAQRFTTPRRSTVFSDNEPGSSTTAYHFEGSPPNSAFNENCQDATTWNGAGGSLTSPTYKTREPHHGYSHSSSIDSTLFEIHPTTRKKVFRKSLFGEKHAVQVVCEDLLRALQQAATNFPGAQDSGKLFSPTNWIIEPYELIVHNKAEIEDHHSTLEEGDTKKHLEWFMELLESQHPGPWQKYEEIRSRSCKQVLFKDLWVIYPPGKLVYKIDDGAWRAYVVERSETVLHKNTAILQIHAWYLDFDSTSERLIPHGTMFEISSYASERPISALELIPDWYIQNGSPPIEDLVDRGKEYWSYGGKPFYKEYKGDAWPRASQHAKLRVIIDYSTTSRYTSTGNQTRHQHSASICSVCTGDSLGLFSYPMNAPNLPQICVSSVSKRSSITDRRLFDERSPFLFCPPRLWAFSLKFKTWKMVSCHELVDVQPQDKSFAEDLYMESGRKKSLELIVSTFVRGGGMINSKETMGRKGRGLNILLGGSSGTGKTFTAECLSEKLGVPLYKMTVGDLGVQCGVLDQKLQETFTRGKNWNSIVLLDDIDIYVLHREGFNLERCALLPTFLRHLEYSECLSFISVSEFEYVDSAFPSRLHLTIPFPKFDFATQQAIWLITIENLAPKYLAYVEQLRDFVNKELWALEESEHTKMNGRQIRNCIDVALIVARNEASDSETCNLRPHHIKTILSLGKEFRAHITQNEEESRDMKGKSLFLD